MDRLDLMKLGRVLFEGNEQERRLAGSNLIAALVRAQEDAAHALLIARDMEKRLEAMEGADTYPSLRAAPYVPKGDL